MMKTANQIKPNYAPIYCAAMYPTLCAVFQRHGYALAVHGSLARDFDLIAVPWTEAAAEPATVLAAMRADGLAANAIGEPERKPHGRLAFTLSIGFGECACDLSFVPTAADAKQTKRERDDARHALTQTLDVIESRGGSHPMDTARWRRAAGL